MLLLVLVSGEAQAQWIGRLKSCQHCNITNSFQEFMKPDIPQKSYHTDVHSVWATHIEVIPISIENGGFEPPSFAARLAEEAISGWARFRDKTAPGLRDGHFLKNFLRQSHAGALNDGFFHFQKNVYESAGDVKKALSEADQIHRTPPPTANSSWPEMEGIPEYKRLRRIVEVLSRRYLVRSGMDKKEAQNLEYSIFNWAAVHGPGEFHGPHTHVGEYHVGVFYAQAGKKAGKIVFGDPRGQNPPFGQKFIHTVRSGDLIFFPSWLSHMATVTAPSSSNFAANKNDSTQEEEPYRVIFSFNIGPVQGPLPCHYWFSDPTSHMGFTRPSPLDPAEVGL